METNVQIKSNIDDYTIHYRYNHYSEAVFITLKYKEQVIFSDLSYFYKNFIDMSIEEMHAAVFNLQKEYSIPICVADDIVRGLWANEFFN